MSEADEGREHVPEAPALDPKCVRCRLVDTGLLYLAVVAPLGLIVSLLRVYEHGWHPIHYLYISLTGLVIIGAAFRKRLSYRMRACLLLGLLLVIGTAALPGYGLVGGGVSLLILFVPITILALGVLHNPLMTSLQGLRLSHAQHERLVDNLADTFLYRHNAVGTFSYLSNILDSMPSVLVGVDTEGKGTRHKRSRNCCKEVHHEPQS